MPVREKPKLSNEQEMAVDLCVDIKERIVGVTGGAGTGKTTILREVYEQLNADYSVVLCAPTGRAAKRIQELTGIPAMTIHRLLEFPQPDENAGEDEPNEPKRNRQNRIEYRIVIVDEASMLGPTLDMQLREALPNNGCIRYFGDNNQLRPVEAGDPPFLTVLQTKPHVLLSFNYRSEDEIVGNANRILEGRLPQRNARFEILYAADPIRRLIEMADQQLMSEDWQVIVPTKKGNYGTARLNTSLQVRLNPEGPSLLLERHDKTAADLTVRENDKFLWIKNDYQRNMFNGEIGRIAHIDPDGGSLILEIEGRPPVNVPPRDKIFLPHVGMRVLYDPRKSLDLGYAVTTHKSQGSEFDTVIYVMSQRHGWMLNRNNFYTAVTRAKKNVILISDNKAMGMSMGRARM